MKMKFKCSIKVIFTCISIFALVFSLYVFSSKNIPKDAFADQQSVSNYIEAKNYLTTVRAEYDALIASANDLYQQIEDTTNQAFEAQRQLSETRLFIGDLAKYEYTNSFQFSLILSIICSDTIEDLFKHMDYANSIIDFQYGLVKEQTQKKEAFEKTLEILNSQTEIQNKYLASATEKLNEAEVMLNNIKAKLSPEELAELEGEIVDIGGGDNPQPQPSPDPDPGMVWNTGIASAYGGSSDPYTPNPGETATGEVCDDWSTGVAIPMAWPNFRQYFHHTVQIRWNGLTVIARINDCGGMGGGSRSLDLQPGVFKAFGFQTCQAWGLRQVDYLIM